MRSEREVWEMMIAAGNSISRDGYDKRLSAMEWVLSWVLGDEAIRPKLDSYIARPQAERRAEWLLLGGKPEDWPEDGCTTAKACSA